MKTSQKYSKVGHIDPEMTEIKVFIIDYPHTKFQADQVSIAEN